MGQLVLPGDGHDQWFEIYKRLSGKVKGFESELGDAVKSGTSLVAKNLVLPEAECSGMVCRFDPKLQQLHSSLQFPNSQENYFGHRVLGHEGSVETGEWTITTDFGNHPEELDLPLTSARKKLKRMNHNGLLGVIAALLNYFQIQSMQYIKLEPS